MKIQGEAGGVRWSESRGERASHTLSISARRPRTRGTRRVAPCGAPCADLPSARRSVLPYPPPARRPPPPIQSHPRHHYHPPANTAPGTSPVVLFLASSRSLPACLHASPSPSPPPPSPSLPPSLARSLSLYLAFLFSHFVSAGLSQTPHSLLSIHLSPHSPPPPPPPSSLTPLSRPPSFTLCIPSSLLFSRYPSLPPSLSLPP